MDILLRVWALGAVLVWVLGVYIYYTFLPPDEEVDDDDEEEENNRIEVLFILSFLTLVSAAWPLLALIGILALTKRALKVT